MFNFFFLGGNTAISAQVKEICKWYAERHQLALPLSPEQLLNAVAEYAQMATDPHIFFGDADPEYDYRIGDLRFSADWNVYQYTNDGWVLLGNIKGTQGETGLDALTYSSVYNTHSLPSSDIVLPSAGFERDPIVGDVFSLVIKGVEAVDGRSWLGTYKVTSLGEGTVNCGGLVVETTGESGANLFEAFDSLKIDTTDATVSYVSPTAHITGARLVGYKSTGNEEIECAVDIPIKAGNNVTVGASEDGKSIEVSASGAAGTKYTHNITVFYQGDSIQFLSFSFTNNVSTPYTNLSDVFSALYSLGYSDENSIARYAIKPTSGLIDPIDGGQSEVVGISIRGGNEVLYWVLENDSLSSGSIPLEDFVGTTEFIDIIE